MSNPLPLEREEYIEQAYFFRTLRERLAENMPAQEVLGRIDEELLSSTRLPMAVQFLAAEIRHHGLLAPAMTRIGHYFTPFQAFVIQQAERDERKFAMPAALLILEREAAFKSKQPTTCGLFVYQFEAISRNRLGYDDGLDAIRGDPFFNEDWRAYTDMVRRQVGSIDFADLVYLRSILYVQDQRRSDPRYEPPVPPLFAEKEGKIAKASRGRDPMFLFAALQRQLDYPEVPRPPRPTEISVINTLPMKIRDLEARVRILEAEASGTFDPTQFGKPELLGGIVPEDE